jgi:hypothetical protein
MSKVEGEGRTNRFVLPRDDDTTKQVVQGKSNTGLEMWAQSFYLVRQARQLMIRRHGQLEQNQRLSM